MGSNYFGSDLNEFINKQCSKEMTCINIDCLLLKRSKKKIRIIESKHSKEKMPFSQLEALRILKKMFESNRDYFGWEVRLYIVRGDPPYNTSTVNEVDVEKTYRLGREDLIQWLEFKIELEAIVENPIVNPNPLSRFWK